VRDADRRKNEFLAMLSHELRNPLAPIFNALQILRLCPADDPQWSDAYDVITRQVHQLAGLVGELLDVFRVMHNKVVLSKESLDLAQLVRVTAEDHRRTLEGAGLRLTVAVPAGPVWVEADRTRLSQVLGNLLQNAAKFTGAGGEVAVALEKDVPARRARLTVRDTGVGIAPEVLPHVFESFIQADRSLDRSQGGLGLGLAMVKGLVELHGGGVHAASRGPNQGTEIGFWLPLGTPARPNTPPAPTSAPARARPLRLLIVEDNVDTARTLRTLLTRSGHDVRMEHTGTAGVEAARHHRPDVVLCDLGLPEMDGFEVAAALRGDPATASVRLVAVSGYGQEEDRRRSEEAGFDVHLTKPVDPAELQRMLAVLTAEQTA
jgi:CheY-like chemotaxis protein/two-component sensor histidine kinase